MRIRKFEARNYTEALAMIRRELGDDAIIMSSTENGRRVEVTAAIDEGPSVSSGQARHAIEAASAAVAIAAGPAAQAYGGSRQPLKPVHKATPPHRHEAIFRKQAAPIAQAAQAAPAAPAASIGLDNVTRELAELREAVISMHRRGYEMSVPASKKEMFAILRKNAVAEALAFELCERAADSNELHGLISASIRTAKCGSVATKAIMVIGPTGVGKTTTIAKLAARAVRAGKRIALVNLDTYRIGAAEQIRIYARILGVPLETAHDVDGLGHVLLMHSDKDLVFIDTTGRNPKDPKYLGELGRMASMGVEVHLLMSAASDEEFVVESCRRYSELPIDVLGLTKADEACRFGAVYNMAEITGRPVAYVTTGQKVPDDIEFPGAAELASMVLGSVAAAKGVA